MLRPEERHLYHISKAQKPLLKRSWTIRLESQNAVVWTWHTNCKRELTAAATAFSGPSQDWCCRLSVTDKGRSHGPLPLTPNDCLLIGSGRCGVIVFSCESTVESSIIPTESFKYLVTQMALLQLRGSQNKTKSGNVEKKFVRKGFRRMGRICERWEGK